MISKLQKRKLGFYEFIDKPTEGFLKDYYSNKYYQESLSSSYQFNYSEDDLEYIKARNERFYSVVKNIRKKEEGSFLDVGCGEGYELNYFKKKRIQR